MIANSQPHDMALARSLLRAPCKGRPAVWGPCHFVDTGNALQFLDAQA